VWRDADGVEAIARILLVVPPLARPMAWLRPPFRALIVAVTPLRAMQPSRKMALRTRQPAQAAHVPEGWSLPPSTSSIGQTRRTVPCG